MTTQPRIAIIGAGTMAEAIIKGLLRCHLTTPDRIIASDPRLDRGLELQERYKLLSTNDNNEAVNNADIIVLSVKPQFLGRVLEGLHNKLSPEALVLSIIAGASIDMIHSGLNHSSIVRSMPNTPAQIGQGITVWTTSPGVSEEHMEQSRQILAAFGEEVYVEEENYLDMATALSGSGPAYVYLFMEAMIDAGVHLGFPRRIAEELVSQTIRGSVEYYKNHAEHPAALRNEVTSPGGTSAAALYYLEKAGIRTAISRAIWAAYERSQELGKGINGKSPERKWGENNHS